jgi:hypothetical protein
MADPVADHVLIVLLYTEHQRMMLQRPGSLELPSECIPQWKEIFLKTAQNKKNDTGLIMATFFNYAASHMSYKTFCNKIQQPVTVHMFKFIPESKARFKKDLGL